MKQPTIGTETTFWFSRELCIGDVFKMKDNTGEEYTVQVIDIVSKSWTGSKNYRVRIVPDGTKTGSLWEPEQQVEPTKPEQVPPIVTVNAKPVKMLRYEDATKTIRTVPGNNWVCTVDSWDKAINPEAIANDMVYGYNNLDNYQDLIKIALEIARDPKVDLVDSERRIRLYHALNRLKAL